MPVIMLLRTWVLFGTVLVCGFALRATGPSSARIELVPIAENNTGIIVFKTLKHLNRSGAHPLVGQEYGWLCASSRGVWREDLHGEVGPDDLDPKANRLFADFESEVDLTDPPSSLLAHLEGWFVLVERRTGSRL